MKTITFNKILQMQYFSSYSWFTQQWEPESNYFSAMQWAACLQFQYVITYPKSDEQHIKNRIKLHIFQVTSDLLNTGNPKVVIAHLCNELEVCNCTMLLLIQKLVNNIFKQNTLNAILFKLKTDLLNIGNLRVAIAQPCNELLCYGSPKSRWIIYLHKIL